MQLNVLSVSMLRLATCNSVFQARTASRAADVRHSATPNSVPATWQWGSVTQICAWPVVLLTTGTVKGCLARTAASKEALKRYTRTVNGLYYWLLGFRSVMYKLLVFSHLVFLPISNSLSNYFWLRQMLPVGAPSSKSQFRKMSLSLNTVER